MSNTTKNPENSSPFSVHEKLPQRLILIMMTFFGIAAATVTRRSITLAITAMHSNTNHNNKTPECSSTGLYNASCLLMPTTLEGVYKYEWSSYEHRLVFASFHLGFLVTNIPGGILSEIYGGKWPFSIGIMISAICTTYTPLILNRGIVKELMVLRFVMGLSQGPIYPALNVLLVNWIPTKHKTLAGSFVLGSGQIGIVIGVIAAGLILQIYQTWEPIFYFFGLIVLIWFIIFSMICFSKPGTSPLITESEKEFLRIEIKNLYKNRQILPWQAILTNKPIWAMIFSKIGHHYGGYLLENSIPMYFAHVLNISSYQNGFAFVLSNVSGWLVSIGIGYLSDKLIMKNMVDITFVRKFCTVSSGIGASFFMMVSSYSECDIFGVVNSIIIAKALSGAYYAGVKLNPLDLSPNFTGTLMGLVNSAGAVTELILPSFVYRVTPNETIKEWRIVFGTGFVLYLVTSLIYGIWASGEIQLLNNQVKYRELKRAEKEKKKTVWILRHE